MTKLQPFLLGLVLVATSASAQLTLQVIVEDGDASTACTDPITGPDPMWGISVENNDWAYFPQLLFVCYTPLPYVAWTAGPFDCPSDLPATVQVCLRAFENDPDIFAGCDINPQCLELTCVDLPISYPTSTHIVEMPDGLSSDGWAQIRIEVSGTPIDAQNDHMCTAADLGMLSFGQTLGNATAGGWSNYCGTNNNDPNPFDEPNVSWHNNVGIWYQFTTSDSISDVIQIKALSDPQGLGDSISLQLGLYTTDDGTCNGTPQWIDGAYTPLDYDEQIVLSCNLQPNTTYFVLVDGVVDQAGTLYGNFGIEVRGAGTLRGGNLKCEAYAMGSVPAGGQLTSPTFTNACADATDDPPATGFPTQQTVWVQFVPPPSGHIRISAFSDLPFPQGADPIDLQLAVYSSSNDSCTGDFSLQAFSYEPADGIDETIELNCLDAQRPYFILVDGSNVNTSGIFTLTITDLGFDGPMLSQNITLCAGDSLVVGNSTYTTSGYYADTLSAPNGCDSIVFTQLTVLNSLQVQITVLQKASFAGWADGIVSAQAMGGLPPYQLLWSHGPTTDTLAGLIGGNSYCLTITDQLGCTTDTCFEMPIVPPMLVQAFGDSLSCAQQRDGRIGLIVSEGFPPYFISWQGSTLSGNDTLLVPNDTLWIDSLSADTWTVEVSDGISDTSLQLSIWAPSPLQLNVDKASPTCFGFCNGQLSINAEGGTPPYQWLWASGDTTPTRTDLCAATYTITITDFNGCTIDSSITVTQPPQFVAQIVLMDSISCHGDSDGALGVQANDTAIAFAWSTGDTTVSIQNLPTGNYIVTVTHTSGCLDTAAFFLDEPPPLELLIDQRQGILCAGQATGVLEAIATGPHPPFTYRWNNGSTSPIASQLSAGLWTVTLTNAKGCRDSATFLLDQPPPLQLYFTPDPIDCLESPYDGIIYIDSVIGGTPPYEIAANNRPFVPLSDIKGLREGPTKLTLRDVNGCTLTDTAYIQGPPPFAVSLGAEQVEIALGQSISLMADATSPYAVSDFYSSDTLLCQACVAIELTPLEQTIVWVTAQDTTTYCSDTDTVTIIVRKPRKVYIPNAFSPDGDGYNERFTLFAQADVVEIELMQIFDRFGNQVFEATKLLPNDMSQGWAGTFKGRPAPPGVYVYRMRVRFLDGLTREYAGEVILVK